MGVKITLLMNEGVAPQGVADRIEKEWIKNYFFS